MNSHICYGWLALIPPLVAIFLSMWKKQVVLALFSGVFAGAIIIYNFNPLIGFQKTFSVYILQKSLSDVDNIAIIVFCFAVGGLIGIITKMGGLGAIANAITNKAKDARTTQLAAVLLGIAIFFDDYANTMLVGKTMRPITDKNRISREKLAFIVDSTAGTVSSMAPISTWIAMELGLIAAGLATLHIKANVLMVYFMSIPFRFYSIFTLVFVLAIVIQDRDFGKMLKAEVRSRRTGRVYDKNAQLLSDNEFDEMDKNVKNGSIWYAVLPIISFLVMTVLGIWYDGKTVTGSYNIIDCMGAANSIVVLTWASVASSIIVAFIGILRRNISLLEVFDAWIRGAKTMFLAGIVLTLIFALKSVIEDMGLSSWIVEKAAGSLNGEYLPVMVFVLTGFIAFAAGSAWGSASIVFPIAMPLAATASGMPHDVSPLLISTIGSVLTGSIFGNHVSPVSDTTILTSVAACSDVVDHVKTQLPYIMIAGIFACVVGFLPVGFGFPAWQCLIAGIIGIVVFIRIIGKKVDNYDFVHNELVKVKVPIKHR
jgi:Na+/H+ antiporter NhaC